MEILKGRGTAVGSLKVVSWARRLVTYLYYTPIVLLMILFMPPCRPVEFLLDSSILSGLYSTW